jgi:hypothetical protein
MKLCLVGKQTADRLYRFFNKKMNTKIIEQKESKIKLNS